MAKPSGLAKVKRGGPTRRSLPESRPQESRASASTPSNNATRLMQQELISLRAAVGALRDDRTRLEEENRLLRDVNEKLSEGDTRLRDENITLKDNNAAIVAERDRLAKQVNDLNSHLDKQMDIMSRLLSVMRQEHACDRVLANGQYTPNLQQQQQQQQSAPHANQEPEIIPYRGAARDNVRRSELTTDPSEPTIAQPLATTESSGEATQKSNLVKSEEDDQNVAITQQGEDGIPPIPAPRPGIRSTGRKAVRRKRPSDWAASPTPSPPRKRRRQGTYEEELAEAVLGNIETIPETGDLRFRRDEDDGFERWRAGVSGEAMDGHDTDGDDADGAYQPSEFDETQERGSSRRQCSRSLTQDPRAPGEESNIEESAGEQDSAPPPTKKKRYAIPRQTKPRFAGGQIKVVFEYVNIPKTVLGIYNEWYHGAQGNASINSLEEAYGTGWRDGANCKYGSNWVRRREKVIKCIHLVAAREGVSLEKACELLDKVADGRMSELVLLYTHGKYPLTNIKPREK